MKEKARLLWRRWESWNESAGRRLQRQCYSGLLGTGDLIANFWKQTSSFQILARNKSSLAPKHLYNFFSAEWPCTQNPWKLSKTCIKSCAHERRFKKHQMDTAENMFIPFLHLSFSRSKKNDYALQNTFHSLMGENRFLQWRTVHGSAT